MTRTKEEKKEYYKQLRQEWEKAKETANTDEITAIINNHGLKISITGYTFVASQMASLGLGGIPYLDAKTYKGWKENGFQVKRGEKSKMHGLTWVDINKKQDNNSEENDSRGYKMAKAYNLFHRSQVETI